MKIGIVGVGIMSSGMSEQYLKAGYEVIIWNRTKHKTKYLESLGARVADSPRDVAKTSDIVFEVTANDESSQDVWLGDSGILAGAKPETILITSATLSIDWVDQLCKICHDKKFSFFDMPLTGGRLAAESGNLTIIAGGDVDLLKSIKPHLDIISKEVISFGSVGSAMRYKLVLNVAQATQIVAFGESMRLAKSQGLDTSVVGSALLNRPGGTSFTLANAAYAKKDIPLTFSIDWMSKDLEYARRMAPDIKLPIFVEVLKEFKYAQSMGYGKSDWASINNISEVI